MIYINIIDHNIIYIIFLIFYNTMKSCLFEMKILKRAKNNQQEKDNLQKY